MKVYFYDKETFKYAGSRDAVLDVLESQKEGKDVYALPANATFVEPPETNFLQVAVFNKQAQSWSVTASNVGNYVLNTKTGKITKIFSERPIRTYEVVLTKEQYNDVINNPIKYEIINGELVDISKTQKYQNKYNIRLYEKKIREEKEKYDKFLNTPISYGGQQYLPRYLDDYYKLQFRSFPQEIWDSTGLNSKVMSSTDFKCLVKFLEDKVNEAFKAKKTNIKRYKEEIAKLEK